MGAVLGIFVLLFILLVLLAAVAAIPVTIWMVVVYFRRERAVRTTDASRPAGTTGRPPRR
jgi:hypothetical protein